MSDFDDDIRAGFLEEAKELLLNAEQCFLNLETAKDDPEIIDQLFRLAHNLKGSAGAVGFNDLKDFTHALESLLLKIKNKELEIGSQIIGLLLRSNDYLIASIEALRADANADIKNAALKAEVENVSTLDATPSPIVERLVLENDPFEALPDGGGTATPSVGIEKKPSNESIRVNLGKIDDLLNNVGELVILQTVLSQQRQQINSPLLQKTVSQMTKIIKEIQGTSMSLRMVPVKQTFQKMQRIVRDTSTTLGKNISIRLVGEETELDKTVIEQLADPLVHLIRNAVDHGVESGSERIAAGKSEQGHICLSAYHRGDKIVIEVRDDGKGLCADALKKKAIEKGILKNTEILSDEDAYQLIFAPGFSTKQEVSDISGRGVGMDVVKTNILKLQGDIELETELGKGTCFRVVLPLTLAIVDGMVVTQGDDRFVIPISQVAESLQPKQEDVSFINETGESLVLRGECLPLLRLDHVLCKAAPKRRPAWEAIALVIRGSNHRPFSVLVDDIICQQQVVIKRLGDEIRRIPGISGAAILGDGRAGLILDLYELTHAQHKTA